MTRLPPAAKRIEQTIRQLGRTRTDPYAWLRADNWQEVLRDPNALDTEIHRWLEAENSYTRERLETPTVALRKTLFKEMQARLQPDEAGVAEPDGPYAYYSRFRPGGEHPLYARRGRAEAWDPAALEMVLLDGDALAANEAYFRLGLVSHSPDHRLVAWTADTRGSEFHALHVRDTATGEDLPLAIENAQSEFVWSNDSCGLYWIRRDDHGRPEAVYWRRLGSDTDELVYREEDAGFFLNVDRTSSRRFITIRSGNHTCTEYRVVDEAPGMPREARLVAERAEDIKYEIVDHDERFVILTNDAALDFRIVTAPHSGSKRSRWQELVPHRAGTLILDIVAFADHLVRLERENGLPRIVVRERLTGAEHTLDFEEAAYNVDIEEGLEYDTSTLRIAYASPARPDTISDYDMDTRRRTLRKVREVPSGHDPDSYRVERLIAPAHDGETIPVTVLRHATTPIDGTAPLLLYGYGAYGHTVPADFSTSRLSLVDRGFVYAIAHVRGGRAKGQGWYFAGRRERKENSFRDFVAVGRHLVREGYAAADRVVGMGGSAGGLLVGGAVNLDPELFAGIIAAVPFVDVVNTISDPGLPLTPPEWPEWGDPIRDPDAYDWIAAYSPYDRTGYKPYPAMLITGGLTDPRVTYWEPAKWVARLRHEAPDGGPYYLRMNMEAGHGGDAGRFRRLHEAALEYAFALMVVDAETGAGKK